MTYQSKNAGFHPVKYLNGAPWNGQVRPYVIPVGDATATFIGDMVKHETTGDASLTGLATCNVAAATDILLGAVVGMEPTNATALGGDFMTTGALSLDTPVYRAASTRRVVYVADDPNIIFDAEEDLDTTPLTFDDTLGNAQIIATAGSTTTGQSAMAIDSTTIATTATHNLKLLQLRRFPGNEFYSSANQSSTTVYNKPRWFVKINSHAFGNIVVGLAG